MIPGKWKFMTCPSIQKDLKHLSGYSLLLCNQIHPLRLFLVCIVHAVQKIFMPQLKWGAWLW